MTLEDAFLLTKTSTKAELVRFLCAHDEPITKAAITRWRDRVPDSSVPKILRAAGVWDRAMAAAYKGVSYGR